MITGIYAIRCRMSPSVYIGQARNIPRRFGDHKSRLRGNRHHNQHLQNAWNKYGEAAFIFEPVEYCHSDDLTMREIEWVSLFKKVVYNIASVEAPMLGRRHTLESIAKMRKPRSEETKARQREALRGRVFSEVHRKHIGARKMKAVVIKATGQRYDSIKEAAAALGVSKVNLSAHLHGRSKSCKGLVLVFEELVS